MTQSNSVVAPDNFHAENHFVPRCYLKGFAGGNGKVHTYRTLVSHANMPFWRPHSTSAIGRYTHLYTSVIRGEQSDQFERCLDAEYESPAKEVFDKVISDSKMSPEDWRILVRFTAAQIVRTPAFFLRSMKRWEKSLPKVLEKTVQNTVRHFEERRLGRDVPTVPHFDQTMSAFPLRMTAEPAEDPDRVKLKTEIVSGRSLWLFQIKQLLTKTATVLDQQRWTILTAPLDVEWFTSDDPVVCLNTYPGGSYDFGGGWGKNGAEVLLPLSPRHVLYTCIGRRPPRRGTTVEQTMAVLIQSIVAEHAFRMIFAANTIAEMTKLRPRHVNDEQFRDEQRQWAEWHQNQSALEARAVGFVPGHRNESGP